MVEHWAHTAAWPPGSTSLPPTAKVITWKRSLCNPLQNNIQNALWLELLSRGPYNMTASVWVICGRRTFKIPEIVFSQSAPGCERWSEHQHAISATVTTVCLLALKDVCLHVFVFASLIDLTWARLSWNNVMSTTSMDQSGFRAFEIWLFSRDYFTL